VSLDGTAAVAARLLAVQRAGLDRHYLMQWGEKIDAIDPARVRSTAMGIFSPKSLSFAVAGGPTGM